RRARTARGRRAEQAPRPRPRRVVEPVEARAEPAERILSSILPLPGERRSHRGARERLLERPLEGGALKGTLDQRFRLLAREGVRERGLEVGPLQRLARDALDHVVVDERTGDRLGKRPRE